MDKIILATTLAALMAANTMPALDRQDATRHGMDKSGDDADDLAAKAETRRATRAVSGFSQLEQA